MSKYKVTYCNSVFSEHDKLSSAIVDLKFLFTKFGLQDSDIIAVDDDIKTIKVIISKEEK